MQIDRNMLFLCIKIYVKFKLFDLLYLDLDKQLSIESSWFLNLTSQLKVGIAIDKSISSTG
jgi:hypothetical protein